MKILSIDVGIKNLAFCLLERSCDDNLKDNDFKILKWDTINLIDQPSCNYCQKPACFSKNAIYYCRPHAKKSDFLIPTQEIEKIKQLDIGGLREYIVDNGIVCNNDQTDNANDSNVNSNNRTGDTSNNRTTGNVKYKKADLMKAIETFNQKKYLDQVKRENAGLVSLISIGINMKARLDEILKTVDNIDKILIENQLSNIAVRMKSLQGMLTQYFIMRGYQNIEYISSTNKLKLLNSPSDVKDKLKDKQKTTYSERKKLGIEYCKEMLTKKGHDEWLQIFLKHGKRDDLADCLLQGLC